MGSIIPASSYGQEGQCKKARRAQSREQASKWHSSMFQLQIPALSFNPSFPQGHIVTWKCKPFLPSCFKSECSVIATESKLGQWLSVIITLRSINKAQTNKERNNKQKEFKQKTPLRKPERVNWLFEKINEIKNRKVTTYQ